MPVLPDSFVVMNDELGGFSAGFSRDQYPSHEIDEDAGAKGEERERGPDEADNRGIGVEMVSDPRADSRDHPAIFRADKLFHTGRMGIFGH